MKKGANHSVISSLLLSEVLVIPLESIRGEIIHAIA